MNFTTISSFSFVFLKFREIHDYSTKTIDLPQGSINNYIKFFILTKNLICGKKITRLFVKILDISPKTHNFSKRLLDLSQKHPNSSPIIFYFLVKPIYFSIEKTIYL